MNAKRTTFRFGFSKKNEDLIKKYSRKIPILKAGNMSLGVNLLMYLTEIASKSLNNKFKTKIYEVHHKHKRDYPSGTALMLGRGIANGKNKSFYKMVGKEQRRLVSTDHIVPHQTLKVLPQTLR